MDISVRDAMATAMWRFHDAAMERATLIYTFARSTNEDTPAGYAVYGRQLAMLIDLVHEFCINARRAIERAEKYHSGIIAGLQALKLHHGMAELELSSLDTPKDSVNSRIFLVGIGSNYPFNGNLGYLPHC